MNEKNQDAAADTLARWFAQRGEDVARDDLRQWPTSQIAQAWCFSSPGRSNRAYLVRSPDVIDFAPSTTTVEEALLMLDEPLRRRHDGTEPSYYSEIATYPWAVVGPVTAAAITRDGRLGAFLFQGGEHESSSAGVLRRQMPDSLDVGRSVHVNLEEQFHRGTPAATAVVSLLGRAFDDGDVGNELRRYDGGKRELWELLNPELVERDRLIAEALARRGGT